MIVLMLSCIESLFYVVYTSLPQKIGLNICGVSVVQKEPWSMGLKGKNSLTEK